MGKMKYTGDVKSPVQIPDDIGNIGHALSNIYAKEDQTGSFDHVKDNLVSLKYYRAILNHMISEIEETNDE